MESNREPTLLGEGAMERLGDRMDEDTADATVEEMPMEIVEESLTH